MLESELVEDSVEVVKEPVEVAVEVDCESVLTVVVDFVLVLAVEVDVSLVVVSSAQKPQVVSHMCCATHVGQKMVSQLQCCAPLFKHGRVPLTIFSHVSKQSSYLKHVVSDWVEAVELDVSEVEVKEVVD
jgi:hypothetical protein